MDEAQHTLQENMGPHENFQNDPLFLFHII